jgi:hypothetical protein
MPQTHIMSKKSMQNRDRNVDTLPADLNIARVMFPKIAPQLGRLERLLEKQRGTNNAIARLENRSNRINAEIETLSEEIREHIDTV